MAAERARQDEELRRLEASRAEAQAKALEAARRAEDARLLDTTKLGIEAAFQMALGLIEAELAGKK